MANTNSPFGFRHLGFNKGGPANNFSLVTGKVISSYTTTALYKGDVLEFDGAGYVQRYTTGTAGSNTAGIAVGFKYLSTAAGRVVYTTYLPTTDHAYDAEVVYIPIAGVPPQLFVVQAYSTYFTAANVGNTLEPTYSTAGTSTGGVGRSGMTITVGSGTTLTYPFRVVDLYSNLVPSGTPGTDDTSNYNLVVVASNPFSAVGV
jgi:hypothetical protein